MKTKEFLVTVFFIIFLFIIYRFFSVKDIFQQICALLVFLVVVPIFYLKIILKKTLSFLGLRIGDFKKGFLWAGSSLFIMGIIIFLIVRNGYFLQNYKIPSAIVANFGSFLFYELFTVLIITLVYEFFFRGFVMKNFSPKIGRWSIVLQWLLFACFIWFTGAPLGEFLPYILFAPFAGFVAYESGSLLYSGVAQFIVIIALDASIIRLLQ